MKRTPPAAIAEVTEQGFQAAVVEASHRRPVVVDFWAPWCGPCHQLSPLIERAAGGHVGDVDVVKVNVDEAPGLARRYRVQGIPAVKAFRDGEVVAEFTGVLPESSVEQFFAGLVPSIADRLLAEAREAGDDARREELLRQAVDADPGHPGAVVALAGILAARGEADGARQLLARVPADAEARRLAAELHLAGAGADAEELEQLRVAAGDGDPQAALRLGRALAARGEHEEALHALVAAAGHPQAREEARASALEVFALLGDDHELVRRWRPRLAAALF